MSAAATAEAAEAAFYGAFAATDLAAMAGIWSSSHPVVCVHPGGEPLMGREAVMQSWAEILTGVAPPRISHQLIERHAGPDLEVRIVEERIQAGGQPAGPENRVIATNVYVREDGGWRLSVHHASLPLMKPRRGEDGERRLH